MVASSFSNIVIGLLLIALAGGIYKVTRSGRIVLLVIAVFLIGLYLFLVGLGLLTPFM